MKAGALFTVAVLWLGCGPVSPRTDTVSRGSPHSGHLRHGQELPVAGEGYARLRPGRGTGYGTPTLVSTIERAASEVARALPGGSRLWVGDLSSRYGGMQPGHRSHRTGRDVDLFYYARSRRSREMDRTAPLRFDRFGLATRGRDTFVFDEARNWHLVRTLLLDPEARTQWIFCSNGVKARLLRYATRYEASSVAVARAAWVLHQPAEVDPHADHFHVRVACSANERTLGCVDTPPRWPWLYDTAGKLEPDARGTLTDRELASLLSVSTTLQ